MAFGNLILQRTSSCSCHLVVTHLSLSSVFNFVLSLVADGAARKSGKHSPHHIPQQCHGPLTRGRLLGQTCGR